MTTKKIESPAPKPPSQREYIASMLLEATARRKDAKEAGTRHLRLWYLKRAEFFEQCALEAQLKLDRNRENQQTEVVE